MRQTQRERSPWLRELSLEDRIMETRKRHRRDSHSSERENKYRKHHHHYKNSDGHCLEKRSSNERLDTSEKHAVFRDHEHNGYAACKDKERNRDRSRSRERHRERERDRDWHHYSKSSGNSMRSSRHRHRHRHRRSHPHSDSVRTLSFSVCRGNSHLSVHYFLVIWTVGVSHFQY